MKYIYFLLPILLFTAACNRTKYVEFDGNMPSINNGAIVIKDDQGNQIISETIFDGKFHAKNLLPKAGYYDLYIVPDIVKDSKKKLYTIYLEGGKYTISADADKMYLYPTIKSTSKIQNELSDYYTDANKQIHTVMQSADSISDILYGKNSPVLPDTKQYNDLKDQLQKLTDQTGPVQLKAFSDYVNKNPQNDVEAYLLSQIDYKKNPEAYNAVYQKFTADQKATIEGKQEGDDLAQLMKLAAGAQAPQLAGKTLDGKPFDTKAVAGKKVVLVEFWRADNQMSRLNHTKLLNAYADILNNKDFAAISVSLDTTQDFWIRSIQRDRLPWIQISDLKGTTSPNMTNWAVTTIPTYNLVDGNWHIIKHDVDFDDLVIEAEKALKK